MLKGCRMRFVCVWGGGGGVEKGERYICVRIGEDENYFVMEMSKSG